MYHQTINNGQPLCWQPERKGDSMAILRGDGELTPDEFLAIQILGRESYKHRSRVTPGRAKPIDILLRIQGTLTVGEPGVTHSKKSPNAVRVLAYLLETLSPDAADAINNAILDLPAAEDSDTLPTDITEGYVARAKTLISRITPTTTGHRNGATSGNFNIGLVDQDALEQSVSVAVRESTRTIRFDEDEQVTE